jgi:hypothetical protein
VSWASLGGGVNGTVLAVAVFNGDLIVAGGFNEAGESAVSNIAKWNGSTWSALGTGLNGLVFALTVHNDGSGAALYAGGAFTTAGGNSASRIAKWNGSSWSALGSGVNDQVRALHSHEGALIAGGWFTSAGGNSANRIAKWSGGAWSALGQGVSGGDNPAVYALNSYEDNLIVGGVFTTAGTGSALYIAQWDGSAWSDMDHMNGPVVSLSNYQDLLVAGGSFNSAGGTNAENIAYWNGASWNALDNGVGGGPAPIVWTLAASGDHLYAGGFITIADSQFSSGIARWTLASFDHGGSDPYPIAEERSVSGPSLALKSRPAGDAIEISYALTEESRLQMEIFDVTGRAVAVLVDEVQQMGSYALSWNGLTASGKKAPAGIYLLRMKAGQATETAKLVLAR